MEHIPLLEEAFGAIPEYLKPQLSHIVSIQCIVNGKPLSGSMDIKTLLECTKSRKKLCIATFDTGVIEIEIANTSNVNFGVVLKNWVH